MSDLIKIENKNGELLVSSREIAKNFEKNHRDVLRDIDNKIESILTSAQNYAHLFIEHFYKDTYKRNQREYLLTRDGFSFMVMGFTGSKADTWKLKYIEAFNEMERKLKEQKPAINSKFLYQLAEDLEEKEKQIALMRPKEVFADALMTSNQSILIGELAKTIKKNGVDIGQNRLFDYLRNNGFIHRKGEQYNLPTQKSMNLKIMETKTRTINNPDGSVRVTKTPKVTGKGQIYFVNKFLENKEVI